jgi:AsmA protein
VSTITKWIIRAVGFLASCIFIAILGITLLVDPNDYSPDLELAAQKNGLTLKIEEDISWSFFPRPGLSFQNIYFEYAQFDQGFVETLDISFNWVALPNILLEPQRLPLISINIKNGRARYMDPGLPPIVVDNLNAAVRNFSLNGKFFNLDIESANVAGLPFGIRADILMDIAQQRMNSFAAANIILRADKVTVEGEFEVNPRKTEIIGSLKTQKFSLKDQIKSIQQRFPFLAFPSMRNNNALSEVSIHTDFSINPMGYSRYTHEVQIDDQFFDVQVEADQTTGKMSTSIDSDLFRLNDYLPNEVSPTNASILTPLALPFIFWQGQSEIKLSVGDIVMKEYRVSSFYAEVFGAEDVLQITTLNADIFDGQLNASAIVDLSGESAEISLKSTIDNLDLGKALVILGETSDFAGQLTLEADVTASGQNIIDFQKSISGDGTLVVSDPIYKPLNIEEMVCNAAALFDGATSRSNTYSSETDLDTIVGSFRFNDGNLDINRIDTAIGNIKMNAQGKIDMLKQSFGINVNMLVNSSKTSSNGCKVNRRLQNEMIPFQCIGSIDPNNSMKSSCVPDKNKIEQIMKNSVIEEIGNKVLGDTNLLNNIFGRQ